MSRHSHRRADQSVWICLWTGLLAVAGALSATPVLAADELPAEVIVLSTLHQLHEETPGYSFNDLATIIETLEPDILAVELTAADLENRREQPVKQEYQRAVFPLLERHDYRLVPLEPPQPLYGELVNLFREAQKSLSETNPAAATAFDLYTDSLYEMLRARWRSPAAVNARETDLLFESKHRFQAALFGSGDEQAWEQWNRYFLRQILAAAASHPGQRILALVGAEHGYWLRAQLAESPVILRDTETLLRNIEE
jgi:hypothetical protein